MPLFFKSTLHFLVPPESKTHIFVDSIILLRERLKPHDIGRGSTHDNIKMMGARCEIVDIVAQHVCFGKQNLEQLLCLMCASSAEMGLGRAVEVITFENIVEEDRSNHWKARWILRNIKRASGS